MQPKQMLVEMMMRRLRGEPLMERALQMAQGKSPEQIQEVAKNLCRQRGLDFDRMYEQYQNKMNQNQQFIN